MTLERASDESGSTLLVLLVVLVPHLLLYCVINHQDVMQHLFMQYLKTLQYALKYDCNTPLSHSFLRKHLTGFRMLKALRGQQLYSGPLSSYLPCFAIMPSLLPVSLLPPPPLVHSSLCAHLGVSKVRELMKTWCKEARIYYSLPCPEGYT